MTAVIMRESRLSVMDETGDADLRWTIDDEASVDIARVAFTACMAAGYMAYKIEGPENRVQIRTFERGAEHIVMVPQTVGG